MASKTELTELVNIELKKSTVTTLDERSHFGILYGYFNAKLNFGAESFRVITHEGCCELCTKTYQNKGVVFDINEIDKLPPLHDKCGCMPVYSTKPPI